MRKQSTNQAMVGELKSLAMISGGLIIGTMGGKAIDKMLKVDDTVPGFQVKKLAKPLVQLGAGVFGALKLKDPNLKLVAAGVGASGVVSSVQVILKKDLLAGIPGLREIAGLGEPMSVYQDPINLTIPRYNPDLPLLAAAPSYAETMDRSTGPAVDPQPIEADFEII
jgi:hypothetical protein